MARKLNHEFINSKGVFQGGGCKAVAFIGAYDAAIKNGVCFTEFAGTSAGSLFAALVAAGADVAEMQRFLGSLDVKRLVDTADKYRVGGFKRKSVCFICKLLGIPFSYVEIALATKKQKGKYEAKVIEQALEEELKCLLGLSTQVRFDDLPYPLTIVASDVRKHTYKIWNRKTTPNESVAKAVSCSCAIPGYFMPVDDTYVDGGLLANLPVSFFDENSEDYSSTLAFTLVYDNGLSPKNGPMDYLFDITSTIINGATNLQLKDHQNNVYVVPVKTKIGLLDFDKLKSKEFESSLKDGYNSFESFLKTYRQQPEYTEPPLKRNQYLLKVASCSCDSFENVVALVDDYHILFGLFLTIVKWKNKCKDVTIYVQNTNSLGSSDFDYAVKLFAHMGIKVHAVYEVLPVLGFYFKTSRGWKGVVVKRCGNEYNAQYYNSGIEGRLISSYLANLSKQYPECKTYSLDKVRLKGMDNEMLCQNLKKVRQYRNCEISFESIALDDLYFMHDFVYGYKYRAIDELVKLYEDAKVDVFSSACFLLANNKESIITPPVIEIHDEKKIVISGLTRLFYAYKQGHDKVDVVVVKGCTEEIPSKRTYHVKKLKIKDTQLEISEKMQSGYSNYRNIERVLRPIDKCFTD